MRGLEDFLHGDGFGAFGGLHFASFKHDFLHLFVHFSLVGLD